MKFAGHCSNYMCQELALQNSKALMLLCSCPEVDVIPWPRFPTLDAIVRIAA